MEDKLEVGAENPDLLKHQFHLLKIFYLLFLLLLLIPIFLYAYFLFFGFTPRDFPNNPEGHSWVSQKTNNRDINTIKINKYLSVTLPTVLVIDQTDLYDTPAHFEKQYTTILERNGWGKISSPDIPPSFPSFLFKKGIYLARFDLSGTAKDPEANPANANTKQYFSVSFEWSPQFYLLPDQTYITNGKGETIIGFSKMNLLMLILTIYITTFLLIPLLYVKRQTIKSIISNIPHKKMIVAITVGLLIVGVAMYWINTINTAKYMIVPNPNLRLGDWLTFQANGISFKYPSYIANTYSEPGARKWYFTPGNGEKDSITLYTNPVPFPKPSKSMVLKKTIIKGDLKILIYDSGKDELVDIARKSPTYLNYYRLDFTYHIDPMELNDTEIAKKDNEIFKKEEIPYIGTIISTIKSTKQKPNSSTFQQYLSKNCHPVSSNSVLGRVSKQLLPVTLNTNNVQIVNNSNLESNPHCFYIQNQSYAVIPFKETGSNNIYNYSIYDAFSTQSEMEWSPESAMIGATIYNENGTLLKVSSYFSDGENPAGVIIRGRKELHTKTGQVYFVVTQINAMTNDSQLNAALKSYASYNECLGMGCGWYYPDIDKVNKVIAKQFFGDINNLTPNAKIAVQEIKNNLDSVTSKI